MTAADIIRETATQYSLTVDELKTMRAHKAVQARTEAARRIRTERKLSYSVIARLLGCSHTMIVYYLHSRAKSCPMKTLRANHVRRERTEAARRMREERGLSYGAIARLLGCSKTAIISYCNPQIYQNKLAGARRVYHEQRAGA